MAAICEEFENHQDGSGELEILMGQSNVLGDIKAEVPLQNENPLNHQILWQQYIERIESLSPESKVSRFCMEAGFLRVVEVGQYSMTKDTGDFRQFRSVACGEYTLPRDDPASQPKGWIQGNMRIGLVLEVTTSFRHFKYGIEIRIWSVNQDNSQSWVRIHYGTIIYVVDSNQNNTEIPADPQEDQVPQTSTKVVAARSKAQAKRKQREPVDTTTTIPMRERRWIDIEPSEQTLAAYDLSKKVISLLRHNQTVQREQDGAIEFYRIKFQVQHWSDERWKSFLAAGGGSKRRYQYCSDDSGRILYLRALQGHSGNNLIDWEWNIPLHLPHWMCIQSSLYYQQWIDTWRSRFEQKTDSNSSCPLIQETKIIKILNILTFLYHVERDTCTVHGRSIKTRYSGLTLILRSEKD